MNADILKIVELALKLNPIPTSKYETTGNKPTVNFEFYGHTFGFYLRIFTEGYSFYKPKLEEYIIDLKSNEYYDGSRVMLNNVTMPNSKGKEYSAEEVTKMVIQKLSCLCEEWEGK